MNDNRCPKCGYPNVITHDNSVISYRGIYIPGGKCGYCHHIEVVMPTKEPRQVIALKDYSGIVYFCWTDTRETLTYDEMRDVEEIYNQALIRQFAEGLE